MTWQPIETAPKDGTNMVLITQDQFGVQRVFKTYWQHHKSGGEGWHVFLGGTEPTHWMLLPDPPP